jgi:hypothetical protein
LERNKVEYLRYTSGKELIGIGCIDCRVDAITGSFTYEFELVNDTPTLLRDENLPASLLPLVNELFRSGVTYVFFVRTDDDPANTARMRLTFACELIDGNRTVEATLLMQQDGGLVINFNEGVPCL